MSLDRRTAYTRGAIKDALFHLLQNSTLEEITVKEICAHADINRATFYRNYHDIYDLYTAIEKELLDRAFTCEFNGQGISRLLAIVYDNQAFYREMFRRQSFSSYSFHLLEYFKMALTEQLKLWNCFDTDTYDISFQYMVYGIFGILKDWVVGGCAQPPDTLAPILTRIAWKQFR